MGVIYSIHLIPIYFFGKRGNIKHTVMKCPLHHRSKATIAVAVNGLVNSLYNLYNTDRKSKLLATQLWIVL
jgi:hypothetical protein